jgi:hypothetical protein
LRRSERWTWEYDVRALAGKSGEGAQQLRTWRSEGWELLSIVEEDGGHRAVLERRGSA